MSLLWAKDLETGFKPIDDQHRELFKKLSEFRAASADGLGRQRLAPMLEFIVQYVYQHFSMEEAYMERKGYPRISEHKEAHDDLMQEYKKLNLVLSEDGIDVALIIRTNIFLGGWWKEHICKVDKEMVRYIKGKSKRSKRRTA